MKSPIETHVFRTRVQFSSCAAKSHLIIYSLKPVIKRNCVYKVHTHIHTIKCSGDICKLIDIYV